jgi:hypothetical protein
MTLRPWRHHFCLNLILRFGAPGNVVCSLSTALISNSDKSFYHGCIADRSLFWPLQHLPTSLSIGYAHRLAGRTHAFWGCNNISRNCKAGIGHFPQFRSNKPLHHPIGFGKVV